MLTPIDHVLLSFTPSRTTSIPPGPLALTSPAQVSALTESGITLPLSDSIPHLEEDPERAQDTIRRTSGSSYLSRLRTFHRAHAVQNSQPSEQFPESPTATWITAQGDLIPVRASPGLDTRSSALRPFQFASRLDNQETTDVDADAPDSSLQVLDVRVPVIDIERGGSLERPTTPVQRPSGIRHTERLSNEMGDASMDVVTLAPEVKGLEALRHSAQANATAGKFKQTR